jgi:hypothetical protein
MGSRTSWLIVLAAGLLVCTTVGLSNGVGQSISDVDAAQLVGGACADYWDGHICGGSGGCPVKGGFGSEKNSYHSKTKWTNRKTTVEACGGGVNCGSIITSLTECDG